MYEKKKRYILTLCVTRPGFPLSREYVNVSRVTAKNMHLLGYRKKVPETEDEIEWKIQNTNGREKKRSALKKKY